VLFAKRMKNDQRNPQKTRWKYGFPPDMDFEAHRAYGTALMSGHGMLPSFSSS
jgi:hypothetical protein